MMAKNAQTKPNEALLDSKQSQPAYHEKQTLTDRTLVNELGTSTRVELANYQGNIAERDEKTKNNVIYD